MAECVQAFRTFHRWLIFSGLLVFGFYLLSEAGLINGLIESDRSYLSSLILVGFSFATLHAGWRAHSLGRETCLAQKLRNDFRRSFDEKQISDHIEQLQKVNSFAHEHVRFLIIKASHGDQEPAQELLLERLNQQIRAGHDHGWFIADVMLKLGLLGTVIGFIFMLGSVTAMDSVDVRALQQLLTSMSDGMRIALYTTLAGLSAGMLLGVQYQLLDRASDDLLAVIIEIGEVHLPRHINSLSNGTVSEDNRDASK